MYDTCMENFNYTFTESEDAVLCQIIEFVNDLGLPEGMDSQAFDTLFDKVTTAAISNQGGAQ